MPEYYTKHKGRYHRAIGLDRFMHNPADGVWLVQRDGSSRTMIARLGEVPDHATHAAFAMHRDLIASVIASHTYKGLSAYDIAMAIIKAVAAKESEQ
jgi:hypothetical protein